MEHDVSQTDARGKYGQKVRRLVRPDDAEADRLVGQLTCLMTLATADPKPESVSSVIVAAFFDGIERSGPRICRKLPLPTP